MEYKIDSRFCYPVSEESLKLALEVVDNIAVEPEVRQMADKIIHVYILNELLDEGCEIVPEEEIIQRYSELILGNTNLRLCNNGMLDVYFDENVDDFGFSVTKEGQRHLQNMKKKFGGSQQL